MGTRSRGHTRVATGLSGGSDGRVPLSEAVALERDHSDVVGRADRVEHQADEWPPDTKTQHPER